jgi:hypothetical protein
VSHSIIGFQQFFSGTGTYTPTTGTNLIWLRMVGAGGGGGGAAGGSGQAAGGGGASGLYFEAWFDSAVHPLTGGPYGVGSFGVGGTSSAGTGGDGNYSYITIQSAVGQQTAWGGAGGLGMSSGTGNGGYAHGGTKTTSSPFPGGDKLNIYSQEAGQPGIRVTGPFVWSGAGGSNPLGGGGGSISSGTGVNGFGYGGGGCGAASVSSTGFAGSSGSSGAILIVEYS